METRYWKTLLVAVETGAFSRAAEILHITQSAVSQRIKFLEEQYGQQLLDRSGPVLAPTEVGRVVLEKARRILEQEQELLEELKRMGGKKRLSLCCTPTFGMAFLPQVLNRFLRQNADLADLKFIFHQPERAVKGLQDHEFELAVIEHCQGLEFSPFQAHSLPQDELVIISSPGLDLSQEAVALDRLLPFRLYARKDGCSSKQLLLANLSRLGRSLDDFRSTIISDDLRLTVEAVLAGGGISFISRSLVKEHLEKGLLRAHQVRGFDHSRSRSLVLAPERLADPLIHDFLECVLKVIEGEVQK